jgi:alkyl sulfatase BDS1-like metallo-beta-lactamase superfamily hydrolase
MRRDPGVSMSVANVRCGNAAASKQAAFTIGALAVLLLATPAAADRRPPNPHSPNAPAPSSAPAQPATIAHNAQVLEQLPFGDRQDFEDAQRGFLGTLPDVTIESDAGEVVFTLRGFEFLQQPQAPATVNPSLWRMAQLNMNNGLFQVTDRVFQVRGFDLANMTIVETDHGVIVIDPLSTVETSRAGLQLYFAHRGARPVKAVIFTHSHHDHYAGARGVISDSDLASGVEVLAPEGFLESAISENAYAGRAMARRAQYMYGTLLPKGERALVDAGLGKGNAAGSNSFVTPTSTITGTGGTRDVDGVEIRFHTVSGTEAPAEMTLYFPQLGVLDSAEIACPVMHNVLTPRGAQVRDPKRWASSLDDLILLYGDGTEPLEVLIAQHHWPRWGRRDVLQLLADQRDLYKYMHDQTLNLLNHGYTPVEIAERIQIPDTLARLWYVRGYYGTLNHNVKAIYQRYLGWYDGNPANLNPLPPVESARKYVDYMGGPQAVTARARQDFRNGEYRWVAQLMNQVVFAYPEYAEGRHLQAEALEQLGYQAESASWRNFYLTGAMELRSGIPPQPAGRGSGTADTIRAMTIPLLFDYWGVLVNADKASGKRIVINWTFTDDPHRDYSLNLSNCALTHRAGRHAPAADAGFTLSRETLNAILLGQASIQAQVQAGKIQVTGDPRVLGELMSTFDEFDMMWPIVTP